MNEKEMSEHEKGMICGIVWAVRCVSEDFGEDSIAIEIARASGLCSETRMKLAGVAEDDIEYLLKLYSYDA